MTLSALKFVVLAAVVLTPTAAGAQANSIMRSFHPEKFEAPAAERGVRRETGESKTPEREESAASPAAPATKER